MISATVGTVCPNFLTSLSGYGQTIAPVPSNPEARELRLHSGEAPCRPLLATPVAEPAVPAGVLAKGARWPDELSFLVADDCSLIVVVAGSRAVAVFSDQSLDTRLYNLRLSWASGAHAGRARAAAGRRRTSAVAARTAFQICGPREQQAQIFGAVVGTRILLRSLCLRGVGLEERNDFLVDRDTASDVPPGSPHFLVDVGGPGFAGKSMMDFGPENPFTWHFRFETERAKCPLVRATPLDESPESSPDKGYDIRALDFLVTSDCSTTVAYFANEAALLSPRGRRLVLNNTQISMSGDSR